MQSERKLDRKVKTLRLPESLQDRGATNLSLSQRHKVVTITPPSHVLNVNMGTGGHRHQRVQGGIDLAGTMRNGVTCVVVQSNVRHPIRLTRSKPSCAKLKRLSSPLPGFSNAMIKSKRSACAASTSIFPIKRYRITSKAGICIDHLCPQHWEGKNRSLGRRKPQLSQAFVRTTSISRVSSAAFLIGRQHS